MAIGFPANKPEIDIRAGQVVINLRTALEDIARIKTWLDGKPDAELIDLGYTSDEVTVLKSAFTDLDSLRKVATAQQGQAEPNDFLFFARRLTGLQ